MSLYGYKLPAFYRCVSLPSLVLARSCEADLRCDMQGAHDADRACWHYMVCSLPSSSSPRLSQQNPRSFHRRRRSSFCTPGMYSAISNLGAGGTQDVSLSDTSNAVLYAMFALTGLISGGINNRECHTTSSYSQLTVFLSSHWSPFDTVLRYTRLCPLRRRALVVCRTLSRY